MIHINYQGRFGNNLFQYFTAILLSNKFNQSVSNPFSNKIFKFNDQYDDCKYSGNLVVNDENIFEVLKLDKIDSNIILDGFFQNRTILEFLNLNRHLFKYEGHILSGTFVHVRLGDISHDGACCKIEYYRKALNGLKGGYISSDSPNDEIVKKLSSEFDLKIFENSPEETIIFGCKFDNKILSLGTFSWWIGFLGNQNNVICPVQKEHREWHGDIFPFLNWKEMTTNN